MTIITRNIEGLELSWVYHPAFDGPITLYKRNPNYTVREVTEIPHEGQEVVSGKDIGLVETPNILCLEHSFEVVPGSDETDPNIKLD